METQKGTNLEEKIRTALTAKWSKISSPEVKEITHDHAKLSEVLNRRYSMSKDDAKNAAALFFKPFELKSVSGQIR